MANPDQAPIKSGFGLRTTASEVLAGIDLSGKTAIVTGGYSGLGLEIVRALAAARADVLVPARRPGLAEAALSGLPRVTTTALDLGDLPSVAAFAKDYLASGRPVHMLINNAAVMANPETRIGPGWESQFATNHLGHFALTCRLQPALEAAGGARVVSVSSTGHKLSPIVFEDVHFRARPYDKWKAYGQAKTANALFAVELDRRGKSRNVRAFACHPGGILTPLQRHLPKEEMMAAGWIDADGNPNPMFKTTEQGAATATWCATSPQLADKGGVYCEDCDIAVLTPHGTSRYSGVDPHAVDAEAAVRLWALSVEATGVDAFA
ncbi:SDR family NAD(P)-dependent oxidoreductase [bacterium]|nr:SDR family NAD(P)-dependent oxidoreductase [bacterium]